MIENNTFKNIALWLIIALSIVIVMLIAVGMKGGEVVKPTELTIPVNPADHSTGSPNPKLTIVEYADYQCPACAAFDPLVKKLMKEYGDRVQLVSRNFPLEQHRNAISSAKAVEAAGKQGKFWEMQEKIYAGQLNWAEKEEPSEIFLEYAKDLNLDTTKFSADLKLPEIKERISADLQGGKDSGVNATPSFFLNGMKTSMPLNYEEFKKIVEKSL